MNSFGDQRDRLDTIMASEISNHKSITIKAPIAAVWNALVDPALIRQYFFGVESSGEWKEGNTIVSKGEWQGKKFQGKSKVLQFQPQKLLQHTYWSDLSGRPDKPENYHIITYELSPVDGDTRLNLTEENLADENMKEQSSKLWAVILSGMKKLLETGK